MISEPILDYIILDSTPLKLDECATKKCTTIRIVNDTVTEDVETLNVTVTLIESIAGIKVNETPVLIEVTDLGSEWYLV